MRNKVNEKIYKTAILAAGIGCFISLLVIAYFTSGSVIYKLFPIWLALGFLVLCFVVEKLPVIQKNKWLKGLVKMVCVLTVGIVLAVI
ncbi:hypothetical protein KQI89_15245 [Clostridium sp. MSJ-4]|uniref:Lipoprotein n=1 Tax=Clostridium simiarum TaxID=2841506 RepID=A0ABS6F4B1_9CLOT|nr:hypothetical protein [Clostridium simiarum]MBU5593103.1 hypothetical protein [Clostridium simiarum]